MNSDVEWYELAVFGPTKFDAYARLRFMPDPSDHDDADDEPDDGPSDDQAKVGRLCQLLRSATGTPDDCYFAIWAGWPNASDLMRRSARMQIPNRTYYLLHGPLSDFGQWGVRESGHNPAAFVWPADHAWCIASDVDQHWAGIGANTSTVNRILAQRDLDIVTVDPDAGVPAQYVRRRQ
ncbi:hypothetical protein [Williamsia sp. R60]